MPAPRRTLTRQTPPHGMHAPWCMAAARQSATKLLSLAASKDPAMRLQAVKALAEFAPDKRAGRVDQGPARQITRYTARRPDRAFLISPASCRRPSPTCPAAATPTCGRLPLDYSLKKLPSINLAALCRSQERTARLAGILAAGFRLTTPPATRPLPANLPLDKMAESAHVIQYADAKVDLRDHWAASACFTLARPLESRQAHARNRNVCSPAARGHRPTPTRACACRRPTSCSCSTTRAASRPWPRFARRASCAGSPRPR